MTGENVDLKPYRAIVAAMSYTLPGWPKADAEGGIQALKIIAQNIAKFCPPEHLEWLLETAMNAGIESWRKATYVPTLRRLYSAQFRPLDQVDEPEFTMPSPAEDPGWSLNPQYDKEGLLPPLPFPEGAFSFDPPGVTTYKEKWMHSLPIWARKGYDPETRLIKGSKADQERIEREADKKRAAMLDILRAQQERQAREEEEDEE